MLEPRLCAHNSALLWTGTAYTKISNLLALDPLHQQQFYSLLRTRGLFSPLLQQQADFSSCFRMQHCPETETALHALFNSVLRA
jgi:hypothetical protein